MNRRTKRRTMLFLVTLLVCMTMGSGLRAAAACTLTDRTWFVQNAYVIDYEVNVQGPYVEGECNNSTSSAVDYMFVYTDKRGSGWKVGPDSLWLTVSGNIYSEHITQRTYNWLVPACTLAIFTVSYSERWDLYRGEVIQRAWCTQCDQYHYFSEGLDHECLWSLETIASVDHYPAWH